MITELPMYHEDVLPWKLAAPIVRVHHYKQGLVKKTKKQRTEARPTESVNRDNTILPLAVYGTEDVL
jgi:hypothetical protein